MHPIVKLITWVVFGYMLWCGFLFIMQRQIIFPRGAIGSPPGLTKKIPGFERLWITKKYGSVETWLFAPVYVPPDNPAPAVIFAHGNAELIDFCPEELLPFTKMGLSVLLVEYPGYGRSDGRPSQNSIREVMTDAYDMLAARKDVDAKRIVLFGRSVGGGAVCTLAAQRPSAALILQSSFTSTRSFAARYLVPPFLVLDPFDNLSVVKNYAKPVLIIHGTYDEIISYSHGVALHRAARKGKMITYACGHNDLPPDQRVYWNDIRLFLATNGILSNDVTKPHRPQGG
jgi:fermentation-respiration switch protein FrsA (DUF1100 family)